MAKNKWTNHTYSENRRETEEGKVYYKPDENVKKRLNHKYYGAHKIRVARSNYISKLMDRAYNTPRGKTLVRYGLTPSFLNILRFKAKRTMEARFKRNSLDAIAALGGLDKYFDRLVEISTKAFQE